jgi:hypothetical protein
MNYPPIDHPLTQEDKVIKKEAYFNLSPEAKEMIFIVTNRPISFVKFAWKYDPPYAAKHFLRARRKKLKKKIKYLPKSLPKKNDSYLENRLTNLSVIQLFFRYRWKKNPQFVRRIVKEVASFTKIL